MKKFSVSVHVDIWAEDEDDAFRRLYESLEKRYGGGNVYIEDVEDLQVVAEDEE